MSGLTGKTVVVAGLGGALGVAVVRALAKCGATIVIIGGEDAGLYELARNAPDRIEPLTIDLGNPAACALLGRTWGDTAVDILVVLTPMEDTGASKLAGLDAMLNLTRAFLSGLRAANGQVVIVNIAARGYHWGIWDTALGRINDTLARALRRFGARSNLIVTGGQNPDAASEIMRCLVFLSAAKASNGSTIKIAPVSAT